MNFLFPTFLWALFALLIPIIIHLFNFRRYKKVYFSNVQFLKDIKQESDSKSKIKEWLILACRLLFITFLVFAFAQPFVKKPNQPFLGNKAIGIYVDNSYSMEQSNAKGTLLENSKNIAIDIVNSFGKNDKFQILTNDFDSKHQRLLNSEEAIDAILEIKSSFANRKISSVINRQTDFLKGNGFDHNRTFLISDFQKNSCDVQNIKLDTAIKNTFVPVVANQTNNMYIDSVWFDSPLIQINNPINLNLRVRNISKEDIENSNVSLYLDKKQVSTASFSVKSMETVTVKSTFRVYDKGEFKAVAKIQDYPVSFDDEFYFSFEAQEPIDVLVVNGKESSTSEYFKSLYGNDSLFVFREVSENAIDFSLFSKSSLIVLNELSEISGGFVSEAKKFIDAGGSLVIIPPLNLDAKNYADAMSLLGLPSIVNKDSTQLKTQSINFEQGFYESVFETKDDRIDLPVTFMHYEWSKGTKSNEQIILKLANNSSFLSFFPDENKRVYLFSTPLNFKATNFLKHALFVPTFLRFALLSARTKPLYYSTSENSAIVVNEDILFKEKPFHIVSEDKTLDIIPEEKNISGKKVLFTQNQINNSGHYQILQEGNQLSVVAFNHNRSESEMDFYSSEELTKIISDSNNSGLSIIDNVDSVGKTITSEYAEGQKLWKMFLILALIFLLCEILVIRILK